MLHDRDSASQKPFLFVVTPFLSCVADGSQVAEASPSDRKELQKAMLRYKTNLDTAAQKAKKEKQLLLETKTKRAKITAAVKTVQKNFATASAVLKKKRAQFGEARGSTPSSGGRARTTKRSNVISFKDVISALHGTADRRREKYEMKKSSTLSGAWVQSFQGVPSSLKKSLFHKIHRRKQQIILRPTEESLVNELRASVAHAVASKYSGRSTEEKVAAMEEEMLKAEQRYLIAAHPLGNPETSTVPPTKSNEEWAEPGWQLNLEVPQDHDDTRILPCAKSFPVLERNLAEIASAPGRQAASLLRACHLLCLENPLSLFAVASSPAEENASLSQIREYTLCAFP